MRRMHSHLCIYVMTPASCSAIPLEVRQKVQRILIIVNLFIIISCGILYKMARSCKLIGVSLYDQSLPILI